MSRQQGRVGMRGEEKESSGKEGEQEREGAGASITYLLDDSGIGFWGRATRVADAYIDLLRDQMPPASVLVLCYFFFLQAS